MEISWCSLKEVLSNGSPGEIHEALVVIKDSVIGSNKQKLCLISYEILPILIKICSNDDDITNKIEALIVISSISKGTMDNVRILLQKYDILSLLKRELCKTNSNKYISELCLNTLCSIFRHFPSTISNFFDDSYTLSSFLSLIYSENSINVLIYVTTVLSLLCQTKKDQDDLLKASTIPILARLICNENVYLQVPVLRCLCQMAFENRSVSDIICVTSFQGRSLLDTLKSYISRSFAPEIQLCASRCVAYIYRSGTLLSSDFRILNRTLPCLIYLCSENFNLSIRGSAAETLSYLIEIDADLQKTAAISNHLLVSLLQLIKTKDAELKQATLKCLAALGANNEVIRKQIVDTHNVVNEILENLNSWDPQVRIASVRCLHSLSRSVQQLRTTFQDHIIWEPLLGILDNNQSREFLVLITATFCNLLLEFSPAKTPLLNSGIIQKISNLADHEDSALKLNCVWAVMNLAYQCENNIKTIIINTFGLKRILHFLDDSNPLIILKTLGLLRNLCCHTYHIEQIMATHAKDLLDKLCIILETGFASDIKEQVLCILANIASMSDKDYIISNYNIMDIVFELLFSSDNQLQNAALFLINNIVHNCNGWFKNAYMDKKIAIFKRLNELNKKFSRITPQNDYVCRILKEIVIQCNKSYPEIFN